MEGNLLFRSFNLLIEVFKIKRDKYQYQTTSCHADSSFFIESSKCYWVFFIIEMFQKGIFQWSVYVGETQKKQHEIPISYLNEPELHELLSHAEEDFEFDDPMGGPTILCRENVFTALASRLSERTKICGTFPSFLMGIEWYWKCLFHLWKIHPEGDSKSVHSSR